MFATSGSRLDYGKEVLRVNGGKIGKDFKRQQYSRLRRPSCKRLSLGMSFRNVTTREKTATLVSW